MKQAKAKPIDLGVLQDTLNATKKQLAADTKALEKAQSAYDKSRAAHGAAYQDLKQASRVVLD